MGEWHNILGWCWQRKEANTNVGFVYAQHPCGDFYINWIPKYDGIKRIYYSEEDLSSLINMDVKKLKSLMLKKFNFKYDCTRKIWLFKDQPTVEAAIEFLEPYSMAASVAAKLSEKTSDFF